MKTEKTEKNAKDLKIEELLNENKTRMAEIDLLNKKIQLLEDSITTKTVETPTQRTSTKVLKQRDVTEADVLEIVKYKNSKKTVKEIVKLMPELNYGQIYSVYNGYTFTSISKILR